MASMLSLWRNTAGRHARLASRSTAWVPLISSAQVQGTFAPCTNKRVFSSKAKGGEETARATSSFRKPIGWQSKEYYDEAALDHELRRVFDICHGCRRCFNLCDSFPHLFEMIDESPSGELEDIPSSDFQGVVDKCTLCDMCYLTKCPYVPPHPFELDFPHLMLRHRAVAQPGNDQAAEAKAISDGTARPEKMSDLEVLDHSVNVGDIGGSVDETVRTTEGLDQRLHLQPNGPIDTLLTDTDMLAQVASVMPGVVNEVMTPKGASDISDSDGGGVGGESALNRAGQTLRQVIGFDERADVPKYKPAREQLSRVASLADFVVNETAPAFKAAAPRALVYSGCLPQYNQPEIGLAALSVLHHNGVSAQVDYGQCCGMPMLEAGQVADVTSIAHRVASDFAVKLRADPELRIISLVPSCTLMLTQEWPLLDPKSEDIQLLASRTDDVSAYIVRLAQDHGLAPGLDAVPYQVLLHHSCHGRAQGVGFKTKAMLDLIPDTSIAAQEKCSGHGGLWGCRKGNYDVAMKQVKPVARKFAREAKRYATAKNNADATEDSACSSCVSSDCPLASQHILASLQPVDSTADSSIQSATRHPIEIFAEAYGFTADTQWRRSVSV